MQLQDTEIVGFGKNTLPKCRIELGRAAIELERIGAIGALQGAAVSQFREKANREGRSGHRSITRLSAKSRRNASTSARTSSGGARKEAARRSAISPTDALPSQACRISTPISSISKMRSGARSTQR